MLSDDRIDAVLAVVESAAERFAHHVAVGDKSQAEAWARVAFAISTLLPGEYADA
jgi:hypothetical protein